MNDILEQIIDELVESDLTAYDLKLALDIIEKYKSGNGEKK